jgi:hypothetical protein
VESLGLQAERVAVLVQVLIEVEAILANLLGGNVFRLEVPAIDPAGKALQVVPVGDDRLGRAVLLDLQVFEELIDGGGEAGASLGLFRSFSW